MVERLVVVLALVAVAALVAAAYRCRRRDDERLGALDAPNGEARWPHLPNDLRSATGPTWVIFTTPLCASCEGVRAALVAHDPDSHVVTVDATVHPELSDRYGVRRAPTTVLADPTGRITERLVGPEAVLDHLRDADRTDALT